MENVKDGDRGRLQRLFSELNDNQAVVDLLRQQISALAGSLSELSMTVGAIKVIKDLQPSTEILVPIGSDSFITAKLSSADKVLTGLGADVMAERSAEETIKVLETRATEVQKAIERTRDELKKLEERIEAIRPEAERLLGRAKEAPGK
ncbi:MAG: prefoldin subunit alpha [Methanobacteriota archaeon]